MPARHANPFEKLSPTSIYSNESLCEKNFVSHKKISMQHKIQRRQLRVDNLDSHYCAALFKYFRSIAVEARMESTILFCDDKANIPV